MEATQNWGGAPGVGSRGSVGLSKAERAAVADMEDAAIEAYYRPW